MKTKDFPILEFDPARRAVIEPSEQINSSDVPEHCVPCFFGDVISRLVESGRAREVACGWRRPACFCRRLMGA